MFVLVTYDIEDDRLRANVAKELEGCGERVQYSVFECRLKPAQYRTLKKTLGTLLKGREEAELNSIRFYKICSGCVKRIEILGHGNVTENPDYYIV